MWRNPSSLRTSNAQLKRQNLFKEVRKTIRFIRWTFFARVRCKLFKFYDCPMDRRVLEEFKVTLRIISPSEVELLSNKNYYSKKIWDNRWKQGAELLGTVWEGKIIEYCWIISDGCYRDIVDGFQIRLNPGEFYLFDYRALKEKPRELRSFKIMKVLVQFAFELLKKRFSNHKIICYVTVAARNQKPLFFFTHYFHAELLTDVIIYKFLFWKRCVYKKTEQLKELLELYLPMAGREICGQREYLRRKA